jgi:HemY protein
MVRVALYILLVGVIAFGAAWLADRPGDLVLQWQGWQIETTVMVAAVGVIVLVVALMIVWTLVRWILHGPSAMSGFFRERRQTRGYKALSRGMVAAGAGDARLARHASKEAHKLLRDEPLTLLLDAQAAQLSGDRKAAIAAFESMTERSDTELLGLRGLLIEAQRAGDEETARACIERAAARAPGLAWAANALLDTQTREGDWEAALATVERNAEHRLIDKKAAKRARAVLLTAQALDREDSNSERAMALALEAHKLAPELVPAAAVAARQSAAVGNARQATRVIEKTWRLSPHPDLAEIYAHARSGDSARDRLKRARALLDKMPNNVEGRIGVAVAAIEARDWAEARNAIEPLTRTQPTQRICMLMADIAEGETGDAGKVREWLSRAVRAPRDHAWTADGYVSETWAPVSPISGRLDAFEWKVPVEALSPPVEDEEPDAAPAPMIESFTAPVAAPVAASAAAVESPGDTQVEPEPEPIDVTPPEAPATADESVPEPAPDAAAPVVPVPAEAEADASPDEAGEPEADTSEATAAAGKDDAATPLPAGMSESDEEAALESAEEAISEFVDEKASGAVAPTVAPIVEGAGAEGVGEDADEAPEKAQPFLMGHAPDDPGPLPPDEGDDRPKKRFGLF